MPLIHVHCNLYILLFNYVDKMFFCLLYFVDFVAKLDAQYSEFIQSAYAESTCKVFLSYSMKYIEFCAAHKLQLYPLNIITVTRYLTHYCTKVGSFSTVSNVVSALKKFYALSGYFLDISNPLIDLLLKSAKRTLSSQSKPKSPIQISHILLIRNVVDFSNPTHRAFFVALVFQFFSCIRKSNLLPTSSKFSSSKCIKRSDVIHKKGSLIIMLNWTKTLQCNEDVYSVCIAPSHTSVIDPVNLYLDFVSMFPVPSCMPVFSYKSKGKFHVLTQSLYTSLLKSHLELIGVSSSSFSTHSVHRGGGGGVPPHIFKGVGVFFF